MRCIVVEDEEITIEHMESIIKKVPFLELVQTFTNPSEALLFLQTTPIDLVFIDIEMPTINGIEFIQMAGNKYKFVVTSAYPNYAVKGFDLDIVDFLHKPFSFDRFMKAVQKVQQITEKGERSTGIENSTIFLKSDSKLQGVNVADICWIESIRNNISVHTETAKINAYLSISDIESQLPPTLFTRIHQSYIIANNRIAVIDKDTVSIRCNNQIKDIPIGDSYRKNFIQSIDPKIIKKPNK